MTTATPNSSRATTQPLNWNWAQDLSQLELAVREAETQLAWDWRRELAALEQELDVLARRHGVARTA